MAIKDLIEHSPKRRAFLKTFAIGTAAALIPIAPPSSRPTSQLQALPPDKIRRNDMVYRRLGRTGLYISEISLGGSPLPDERLLFQLVERGINYIDTSDSYENGNCERKVGRLFKAVGRDKIHIHARFHLEGPWTEASLIASVERSLRRLGTDQVEILGIHGVEKPEHLTDERILGAFEKLKGKYRFRGLTCHVNQHTVIPKAVESGLYDMVQIGYNVFDIQETEKEVKTYIDYLGESGIRKLINLARSRDVGVTAMKVLKIGGRRQDLTAYKKGGPSLYPAMLKWALENEKLSAVVTEILNEEEMKEDLGAVGLPLAPAERRMLHAHVAANAGSYCHSCGLCQAACPEKIRTADISRCLAYAEGYGKRARAQAEFATLLPAIAACEDCGACERACPYGLLVRDRTRRAEGMLA
ncbi:MAG: aldo/keto reductase [Candidatus Aminicenantes bacterium]|nr:aldo/keto reductase [Candidatus Aminicenantes bacterium]